MSSIMRNNSINIVPMYMCDICNEQQFSTFKEAEKHEKICTGPCTVISKNGGNNGESGNDLKSTKLMQERPKQEKCMNVKTSHDTDDNDDASLFSSSSNGDSVSIGDSTFPFLPLMTLIAAVAADATNTANGNAPPLPPAQEGMRLKFLALDDYREGDAAGIPSPPAVAVVNTNHNAVNDDDNVNDRNENDVTSAFEKWKCLACTFHNSNPLYLACAICGTARVASELLDMDLSHPSSVSLAANGSNKDLSLLTHEKDINQPQLRINGSMSAITKGRVITVKCASSEMMTSTGKERGIEDGLENTTTVLHSEDGGLSPPLTAGPPSWVKCTNVNMCSRRYDVEGDMLLGGLEVTYSAPFLPLSALPQPHMNLDQIQQEPVSALGSTTGIYVENKDRSEAPVSEAPRTHPSSPSFTLLEKCGVGGTEIFKQDLHQSKPIMSLLTSNVKTYPISGSSDNHDNHVTHMMGEFKNSSDKRHMDLSSRPDHPGICMGLYGTMIPSKKEFPRKILYPVGCPVWFNLQYSHLDSRHVRASVGVVKSFSFDQETYLMMYEVDQIPSAGKKHTYNNASFVPETEVAFAVHCPVVLMGGQFDVTNTETEGKIVNIEFNKGKHGGKILYSVLYTAKEGGVLVEKGVVAKRISYTFSLHALQSRIRNIVVTPGNHRAIGIRCNVQNEPMQNISPQFLKVKKRSSHQFTYSKASYDVDENHGSNFYKDNITAKRGRM
jgi:hypothetical protein